MDELREIAEEIAHIDYGELHIVIRRGKIVSYTTIKSKLVCRDDGSDNKERGRSVS